MTIDNLKRNITTFEESVEKLKEAINLLDKNRSQDELAEVCKDAVVKRFEVAFEYCWKVMKVAADYQGIEAFGPRPAIQESIKFGWIEDPEFWANALDARNGSVHDYFGITMEKYIALVKKFAKETDKFLERLRTALKLE